MIKKLVCSAYLLKISCVAALVFFALTNLSAQTSSPSPRPSATPSVIVKPTPQPSPSPQEVFEDNEPIRIDTEEYSLNVRVVDRNNRSISNLSQKDFKVFEDNVELQITSFTRGDVPTNYALVIDNSGSLRHQLEKVIEASKIIVSTNRSDDETAIYRFVDSDKIELLQDFTPNKTYITDALDSMFIEGGQTAIIDAVYLAAEKTSDYEKSRNARDKKRRALILVTDGEDRDSFYNEKQLFELLRESDVQIYIIGFVNELSSEGGFITKSPQGKAKSLLERMAKETGGKVYFPTNMSELNNIANDISNELRTQYLLTYKPSDDQQSGTYKNIKVSVADGANNEKRIAITRSGRLDAQNKPTVQKRQQ